MLELPTVSCLMPTLDRLDQLRQSILCFCRQTYPKKELVIASEGTAEYKRRITEHLAGLGRSDIRCVFVDGDGWNLGRMRNLTIEMARGELLCQWDDDDLNHPLRLALQVKALLRRRALSCYLTEQLQYFEERNQLYWVNWDCEPDLPLRVLVIPGTVLCWRSIAARYPESGPDSERGEDMTFLDQLIAEGPVARLSGHPHLYVYRYHGRNVWSFTHHWNIVHGWARTRSSAFVRARRRRLERELGRFDWGRPEIELHGSDGPAFRYRARAYQPPRAIDGLMASFGSQAYGLLNRRFR